MRVIILVLILVCVGAFASPKQVSARGIKDITVQKILLVQPVLDSEVPPETGKIFKESLLKELVSTFRFEVIDQSIDTIVPPISLKKVRKQARHAGADTIVMSTLRSVGKKMKLSISFVTAKSGDLYAIEKVPNVDPGDFKPAIKKIVKRLVARLPYKALVKSIEGNRVSVDAGTIHGLTEGKIITIIEIKEVKRHPFSNELIGFVRDEIGRLTVLAADELSAEAVVKELKEGVRLGVGSMVWFEPDYATAQEMQTRAEILSDQKLREHNAGVLMKRELISSKRTSLDSGLDRFSLEVGSGIAWGSYSFRSNNLDFDRDTTPVPIIGIKGQYWFLSWMGIDASYEVGKIKFDSKESGISNTTVTTSWGKSHLTFRHPFSIGTRKLMVETGAGYGIYVFDPDQTDDTVFLDSKYSGVHLKLSGEIQWTPRFSSRLSIEYQPILSVKEEPVKSGGGGKGIFYGLRFGGGYRITRSSLLGMDYRFGRTDLDFDGSGDRGGGVLGSESKELLHGLQLKYQYVF